MWGSWKLGQDKKEKERLGALHEREIEGERWEGGMAKGRRHPRAQGNARSFLAAPVSEARATRKKVRRKRVASVLDSRYSSMRRAPTTNNLRHLHPATVKKKKKKKREIETEREVKNGKRAQYSVVSSDEFSSAQGEGGAERTLPDLSRSHLVAGRR